MARPRLVGPAGIMCFCAGCLIILFAVLRQDRNIGRIALGGMLILLGIYWMGSHRRGRHNRD